METIKSLLYTTICIFLFGCINTNKSTSTINSKSEEELDIYPYKDAAYYLSKGYQVFSDFEFAVKCPVVLKDVSILSNENFDFNHAANTDDTFYQITVTQIPAGRKDLTVEEYDKFLDEMFSQQPTKKVLWGEEGKPAYLFDDYMHNEYKGRGIAVPHNGRIYGFNLMTIRDIDAKFNGFTNNIKFLNKNTTSENIFLNENNGTSMREYIQTGLGSFSISYPHDWTLLKNPYKGVDVMIAAPAKIKDSEANINIIISVNENLLEILSELGTEQISDLVPSFSLLSKEYTSIEGMRCIKVVSRIHMQRVAKIISIYQFKKEDNTLYTITSTFNENSQDNYKGTFDQIIKSFKLL